MVRLGVRGRLFLVSLLGILTVILIWGGLLERNLRQWLEASVETRLLRQAQLSRELLIALPGELSALDPLADRLGRAGAVRVTIIAADGRVLGDSQVEGGDLAEVENHALRTEVMDALRMGHGSARRHSATVDQEMLYVAVPFVRGDTSGVVRMAMSLEEVSRAVQRLRGLMVMAGLAAVGMALILVASASHLMTRTLRQLVVQVRALTSHGEEESPPDEDEIAKLAGSFNRLAEELQVAMAGLSQQRDRLEAVLQGMDEGVMALDRGMRVTLVNRSAQELLGCFHSPLGRHFAQFLPQPEAEQLCQQVMQTGRGARAEVVFPGPPARHLLAQANPTLSERGAVLVLRDVTEARRLEKMRRDFVANASHELRTPVGVIRINAETLLDGALDDQEYGRNLVLAIERHALRLSRLISHLMDLSRLEGGDMPLERRPLALRTIAEHTVEGLEPVAAERHVTLENRVPPDTWREGDPEAVEQVLVNLLNNAIHYIPEGGRVRVDLLDGRMVVEDNGPGIPPEHHARLFERFYRVDPGRTREMGGTGLGLAIVKHLVENMGGRVGMEPVKPHGSRFWFTLPRLPAGIKPVG